MKNINIKNKTIKLIGFIICLLLNILATNKIHATGFDYMSNASYNNTAQIVTEEEYYYNNFVQDFSYYQLNDNYFNPSTLTKGSINGDGGINGSSNRAITPYINVVNRTINLKLFGYGNSGYSYMRIGIHGYNNGNHLSDSGWLYFNSVGTKQTYTLPSNANQMRFIISMGNRSNFDTNKGEVATNISNLTTLQLYVSYNTPTTYYKYTGYNNYQNLNVYGTFYDLKPNTDYTFFTPSFNNLTINDLQNIYLAKNCNSANINTSNCEVYKKITTISYNSNNKSYVIHTPNYSGYKGIYYLILNKGVSGATFPELSDGINSNNKIMLLEGNNYIESNNYYASKLKNYYIKTKINSIYNSYKTDPNNNYGFTGHSIWTTTSNVALFNLKLTPYNESGIDTDNIYYYKIFINNDIVNPELYNVTIPNLYDLNLDENGNIYGSMPNISLINNTDYNISLLNNAKPNLYATWEVKNQYLGNSIGLVGQNLYKGFYNSYGIQGNNYDVQLKLSRNYEFKNRFFSWYEFTDNLYLNGNNYNQMGFFVWSIGVKNTLTDNSQITPPNSNGFGNSEYEIYNTCNGNLFNDFGCYVSNAVTWTIFNVPIIGPMIKFITQLIILVSNLVVALKWYESLGILFSIFLLIMFIKILGILWKGKDE